MLLKNQGKVKRALEKNIDNEILENINTIKRELDTMYNQFEFLTDPLLIDSCIFSINANLNKYAHYIKLCKERNISL